MPTSKQWEQNRARWAKWKALCKERRRLIEAPLPQVRVLGHSSAWGGVYVRDTVPTEGRRVWENMPEDEEWCRSKWEEK